MSKMDQRELIVVASRVDFLLVVSRNEVLITRYEHHYGSETSHCGTTYVFISNLYQ